MPFHQPECANDILTLHAVDRPHVRWSSGHPEPNDHELPGAPFNVDVRWRMFTGRAVDTDDKAI